MSDGAAGQLGGWAAWLPAGVTARTALLLCVDARAEAKEVHCADLLAALLNVNGLSGDHREAVTNSGDPAYCACTYSALFKTAADYNGTDFMLFSDDVPFATKDKVRLQDELGVRFQPLGLKSLLQTGDFMLSDDTWQDVRDSIVTVSCSSNLSLLYFSSI